MRLFFNSARSHQTETTKGSYYSNKYSPTGSPIPQGRGSYKYISSVFFPYDGYSAL